jgi:FtsH-binding integral membrane protein
VASTRSPGWREVLLVAGATVAAVLLFSLFTTILPPELRQLVSRTPLLIAVLVVGTALVLWRIAARRPPDA